MATKAVKAPRKRPDPSGVACRIVDLPPDLCFGRHGVSPYDGLLKQLAAARGKVIEAASCGAKGSFYARAKKLGMKVVFAEADGKLYVKFAGWQPDSPEWKQRVRDEALAIIGVQQRNPMQIAIELRARGYEDVDAGLVDTILKQMEQEKLVKRFADGSWGQK